MRIGLFAHRLAPRHPTGIGRYTSELAAAVARVADRDEIVLVSTPEGEPACRLPGPIPTHVLPWPRRPVQAAWCLDSGPALERSLGQVDVVHLVQPFPPARSWAPQVATVHDLFPFEHPEWYRPSERWTYRRSVWLVIRRAARIVVPSAYVRARLVAALGVEPARIAVVPQGVSGAFGRARDERRIAAVCGRFGLEPGRFVVSVGAVSTRKNAITLVRAMGELGRGEVALALVGPDGYGAKHVDAEIARNEGGGRVVRTGYLSDADTATLVQAAAVLAHPTLAEGFGFVPLEAMAADTPVIAARTAAIPEVVANAALLVDEPTNPRAWARAIAAVCGSAERRAELAAAGARRAASFSWERTARRMLGIYADAVRSCGSASRRRASRARLKRP
jgi:glycosyltransferase involved in cell wall biosynthesis